jgi:hypothetical protein
MIFRGYGPISNKSWEQWTTGYNERPASETSFPLLIESTATLYTSTLTATAAVGTPALVRTPKKIIQLDRVPWSRSIADDFNIANGPLGANWTATPYNEGANVPTIVNNKARAGSTQSGVYWNAANYTDVAIGGSAPFVDYILHMRYYLRLNPTGINANGYVAQFGTVDDSIDIIRYDNGVETSLWYSGAYFFNYNEVMFTISGSTISIYQLKGLVWVLEHQVSDSTYPGPGRVGFSLRVTAPGTRSELDYFYIETTNLSPPADDHASTPSITKTPAPVKSVTASNAVELITEILSTTYYATLDAVSTGIAILKRDALAFKSIVGTGVPSYLRTPQQVLSVASGASVVTKIAVRIANSTLTATAAIGVAVLIRTPLKLLTATAANTVVLARSATHIFSVTITSVSTKLATQGRTLIAVATNTVSKAVTALKTLIAWGSG